jgi:hypothetical protein
MDKIREFPQNKQGKGEREMEDKYKTLAAQIDNIYKECDTVNMDGVARLIQCSVETQPYSKYMSAADEAWSWFVNRRSETFPLVELAEIIKAEIERPEPLLPGVRYKNTDKNRARIPKKNAFRTVFVNAFWDLPSFPAVVWFEDERCFKPNNGFSERVLLLPIAFSLIPDGEVQDE